MSKYVVYPVPSHNPPRPLGPSRRVERVPHGGPKARRLIARSSDDAIEGIGTAPVLDDAGFVLQAVGVHVGLRFNNIPVYQGMKVARAYIEVTLTTTDKNDAEGTWYCEDVDDAPTFTTTDGNIDGRTKTTASVAWTENDIGLADQRVRTPDLSPILQEVIDRPGWQPGNNAVFFYVHNSATDKIDFRSWDHATAEPPSLYIEYLPAVPGHWREEEDKWADYTLTSEVNRGFRHGDAGATIMFPADGTSFWSHADTLVGSVDANGYVVPVAVVKNSVVIRNRDGTLNGQIYSGAGVDPAWRHPDHPTAGFTQMDMVFDGAGTAKQNVIVIGWSEPTEFGTNLREGLILTLDSAGQANVFTQYSINNGLFFVTSCFLDAAAGFHYIIGLEFVIGPNSAFRTHEVRRYTRLARAAVGDLTNSSLWEYWTGAGWSTTQSNAVRLTDTRGYLLDGYADITRRGNDYFMVVMATEREVVKLYKSSAPSGPWAPYAYFDLPHRRPLGGGDPPSNTSYWSGFPKFQEWLDPSSDVICISHSFGLSRQHFDQPIGNESHHSQAIPNLLLLPLGNPPAPDIRVAPLTSGVDLVDAASYVTASVTVGGAGKVVLVAVHTINSTSPNSPTLSGPSGMDWAVVRDFFYDQVSTFRRLTVFAGTAAAETTGTITIAYGGQNQNTVEWSVSQADDIDTATNKGVVQSATHDSGTAQAGVVTLANAISNSGNVGYGAFANDNNLAYTPGTSFFELHDLNASPDAADGTLFTEFINGLDTTIEATASGSIVQNAGVALELAIAGSGRPFPDIAERIIEWEFPTAVTVGGAGTATTPGTFTLTPVAVTPIPGPSVVAATIGALTLDPVAVTPTPGPVTAAATPGALTLDPVAVTPTPGPVSTAATTGALTLDPVAVTPTPGPVSVAATTGSFTLDPVAMTTPGGLVATPGALTLNPVAVTPTPGPVTQATTAGALTLDPVAVTPTPGPSIVAATIGALTLTPVAATPISGADAIPGTLTLVPVAVTPTPGAVTVAAIPGALTLAPVAVLLPILGEPPPPVLHLTAVAQSRTLTAVSGSLTLTAVLEED